MHLRHSLGSRKMSLTRRYSTKQVPLEKPFIFHFLVQHHPYLSPPPHNKEPQLPPPPGRSERPSTRRQSNSHLVLRRRATPSRECDIPPISLTHPQASYSPTRPANVPFPSRARLRRVPRRTLYLLLQHRPQNPRQCLRPQLRRQRRRHDMGPLPRQTQHLRAERDGHHGEHDGEATSARSVAR